MEASPVGVKRRRTVPGLVALSVVVSLSSQIVRAQPAPSFTDERLFSKTHDDWEPSIAADDVGHVYLVTTRYGIEPLCPTCPSHRIVYKVSSDGGQTWSAPKDLCRCAGFKYFQNDPMLVTDDKGRVFAAMLNNFNVTFRRSDNFGQTWTKPVLVHERSDGGDKPWIGVSADGEDVYITYNRIPGGTPYGVASHDAGETWGEPVRMIRTPRYWFAGGLTVLPDGTVLTSQIAQHQNSKGDVLIYVVRSADSGQSWSPVQVDTAQQIRPWSGVRGLLEDRVLLGVERDSVRRRRPRLHVLQPEHGAEGAVAARAAVLG